MKHYRIRIQRSEDDTPIDCGTDTRLGRAVTRAQNVLADGIGQWIKPSLQDDMNGIRWMAIASDAVGGGLVWVE